MFSRKAAGGSVVWRVASLVDSTALPVVFAALTIFAHAAHEQTVVVKCVCAGRSVVVVP